MKCLKILLALLSLTGFITAQDSVFVTINSDTVNIWNTGAYENCGFLVEMETIFSNDTITIIEHDTSCQYAYCNCNFDMYVSLTGLSPGSYHVDVFRTYDILYDPDSIYYIGSTNFIYYGTAGSLSEAYFQSECYNATSIAEPEEYPNNFLLLENFPNPFNPKTTIRYSITNPAFVNLTIYNVLGKEIINLVNENQERGAHVIQFDGSLLSSGVYFITLRMNTKLTKTIKTILIK